MSTVIWPDQEPRDGRPSPRGPLGRQALVAALADAARVVVRDPLTFPWDVLDAEEAWDVPLSVELPAQLDASEIAQRLGPPLLERLTPYDVLLEPRRDVRTLLERAFGLSPRSWADGHHDDGDVGLSQATAKRHLLEVASRVRTELAAADVSTGPVHLRGRAEDLGNLLGLHRLDLPAASPGPALAAPSPHAAVIWCRDGGGERSERHDLVVEALEALHPGSPLVVVGYVVTGDAGLVNPSFGELFEDLVRATGGMVHVDEVRSVRWAGEELRRGVVVRATTLTGGARTA